jgi:hypothetical protein
VKKKKRRRSQEEKERDETSSTGEIKYVVGEVVSNPVLSKNRQSPVLTWVSKK